MALYRARPEDGVAWITGASTGIGRQLAIDLASEGYTVAATARDEASLAELEEEAHDLGGRIVPFLCDVADEAEMERTVARIEKQTGPIALAIFNAGTFHPTHGERMETYGFVANFKVNLLGVVFGLVPVVDRMRERGFGQLVLVGSIVAYFGMPSTAAYGASKAALNNMAQALKYDLDKLNIRIQIVNPGFVDTPMLAKHRSLLPALMTVEEASRRMVRGIRRGGFEIAFPRRLIWPLKAGIRLPAMAFHWLIRKLTGWDRRRFGRTSDQKARRRRSS
jgi:NAD(P)-dependent dehydrogenase (short-subunit alcohol dehydrogenase family)